MCDQRFHARVLVGVAVIVAVSPMAGMTRGQSAGASEMPAALQRAVEARSALRLGTGHIECMVTEPNDRHETGKRARFLSWKCAGDRCLVVNRGDAEGVVARTLDGAPSLAAYPGPVAAITWNGEVWTHRENSPEAYDYGREATGMFDLFDMRQFGLNPAMPQRNLEDTLAAARTIDYSSRSEGGLELVTAKINGEGEFRWWIDPARDWSVVRTAVIHNNAQLSETHYELQNADGYWFPARITFFDRTTSHTEPKFVWEIVHAEFNRPEHPIELTPAHIGIEVGTRMRRGDATERRPGRVWTGAELVSVDKFQSRVESGELRPGPTITRETARLRARHLENPIPYDPAAPPGGHDSDGQPVVSASHSAETADRSDRTVARGESPWQRYTREFISRFGLSAEQTDKAWSVCRACQAHAREHYRRKQADFAMATAAMLHLPAPQASLIAAFHRGTARLNALLAPIHRIFHETLVPKLDSLPTRAQRKAATNATGNHQP